MKRRREKTDRDPCEWPIGCLTFVEHLELERMRKAMGKTIADRAFVLKMRNYTESRQYGRPKEVEIPICSTEGIEIGGENRALAFFQWHKGG